MPLISTQLCKSGLCTLPEDQHLLLEHNLHFQSSLSVDSKSNKLSPHFHIVFSATNLHPQPVFPSSTPTKSSINTGVNKCGDSSLKRDPYIYIHLPLIFNFSGRSHTKLSCKIPHCRKQQNFGAQKFITFSIEQLFTAELQSSTHWVFVLKHFLLNELLSHLIMAVQHCPLAAVTAQAKVKVTEGKLLI